MESLFTVFVVCLVALLCGLDSWGNRGVSALVVSTSESFPISIGDTTIAKTKVRLLFQ
jgi:hypothetical protein